MANELANAVRAIREYVASPRFREVIDPEDVPRVRLVVGNLADSLTEKKLIDVELLETSRALTVAGYLSARYDSAVDELREKTLDITAQVERGVRAAALTNTGKTTEGAIASEVRLNQKLRSAKELEARMAELARILKSLLFSLQTRFRALEQTSNNERADRRDS